MTEAPSPTPPTILEMLNLRKVLLQTFFWLIGVALLGWIIYQAVRTGDWSKITGADPRLVAILLGCTVLSLLINGATFWITIQSIRRVSFFDMQVVNAVGNMLNYAPIRLGAIARVVYHHRVDRLGLLQIGAWFAMIAYILALGVGSCLVATLIHDRFDWIWFLLVVGQMAAGAIAAQVIAGHRLFIQYGRGADRMVRDNRAMWGAIGLRLVDIGAYTGRMAAALAILGIHLPLSHIIVLALVALAASLIPFGRVGFREFCVAAAGARLGSLTTGQDMPWEQLALIESAGEAIIFIPLGMIGLIWFRKRWRERAQAAPIQP